MGLSTEDYAKLCALAHGVEIREDREDGDTLFVDGVEVWRDHCSQPEDVLMSRDLSEIVVALRKLAMDRDDARTLARSALASTGPAARALSDTMAERDAWKRKAEENAAGFSKAFEKVQEKHDAMRAAMQRAETAEAKLAALGLRLSAEIDLLLGDRTCTKHGIEMRRCGCIAEGQKP